MNDWYPSQDAKLLAFFLNFVANIDAVTAKLGLPAGTFEQAKTAASDWLTAYDNRQKAQKAFDAAQATLGKRNIAAEQQVRAAAKQIKGIINVPADVLTELQLTSTGEATQDRAGAQVPDLRMSVELGRVLGKYTKRGHQAVRVYGCRTGETEFTLLGTYTLNRFEDPRPNRVPGQPEQRQYYAVYVDKDQPVGQQSPIVTVVVGSRPGGEA